MGGRGGLGGNLCVFSLLSHWVGGGRDLSFRIGALDSPFRIFLSCSIIPFFSHQATSIFIIIKKTSTLGLKTYCSPKNLSFYRIKNSIFGLESPGPALVFIAPANKGARNNSVSLIPALFHTLIITSHNTCSKVIQFWPPSIALLI
jgi:hypothetical protein